MLIKIVSATYNDVDHTVTLHPVRRLPLSSRFRLTVGGSGPKGITDRSETLLDGRATGQPGSDYVTTISRSNLVFTLFPKTSTAKTASRRHAAQVTRVSAHALGHLLSRRVLLALTLRSSRAPENRVENIRCFESAHCEKIPNHESARQSAADCVRAWSVPPRPGRGAGLRGRGARCPNAERCGSHRP